MIVKLVVTSLEFDRGFAGATCSPRCANPSTTKQAWSPSLEPQRKSTTQDPVLLKSHSKTLRDTLGCYTVILQSWRREFCIKADDNREANHHSRRSYSKTYKVPRRREGPTLIYHCAIANPPQLSSQLDCTSSLATEQQLALLKSADFSDIAPATPN